MTKRKLKKILKLHQKWLQNKPGGVRAYLGGANLQDANLSNADLQGAYLPRADLREANLSDANLSNADLSNADLSCADLQYADLKNANLLNACLWDADLKHATNIPFVPLACPDHGKFTAFKVCFSDIFGPLVAELLIPADAKRSSATTRICRASYAKVLSITNLDGTPVPIDSVTNGFFDDGLVYKVGEFVYPESFDNDRWNECSYGIHFFINRQDAVDYHFTRARIINRIINREKCWRNHLRNIGS